MDVQDYIQGAQNYLKSVDKKIAIAVVLAVLVVMFIWTRPFHEKFIGDTSTIFDMVGARAPPFTGSNATIAALEHQQKNPSEWDYINANYSREAQLGYSSDAVRTADEYGTKIALGQEDYQGQRIVATDLNKFVFPPNVEADGDAYGSTTASMVGDQIRDLSDTVRVSDTVSNNVDVNKLAMRLNSVQLASPSSLLGALEDVTENPTNRSVQERLTFDSGNRREIRQRAKEINRVTFSSRVHTDDGEIVQVDNFLDGPQALQLQMNKKQ